MMKTEFYQEKVLAQRVDTFRIPLKLTYWTNPASGHG